ncbi:MAG: uroporphyrinogen-III C-methyltransferase [Alphaproteobacteria bacterium]|nr:uroporphyrinogen-III C-methyltransferase [Alphaproteobacteria bacterium]
MRYFPLFMDTRGLSVLVVGGGAKAAAKLRLLLKTEAQIEVISESIIPEIEALSVTGRLRLTARFAVANDVLGRDIVYIASQSQTENIELAAAARAAGALVNMVDNREASDILTPAIVDRDPVVIAIGTEGTAPLLARSIKADLEAAVSPRLGTLARIAGRYRGRTTPRGLRQFFAGAGERTLEKSGEIEAERLLNALADGTEAGATSIGRVALVGAGPGDPELLTLRARKRLDEADVVLYDRLVAPAIIELARREATLIEVGKTPFGPAWSQAEINATMIEAARGGAFVVRLKSGDPLVFGRADEEIGALEAAGIAYDIVPGISAAFAAAAAGGFSLTKRGRNRTISFLTAHDTEGFAEHDWRALARPGEAFAIYMGVRGARFVQGRLLIHGASSDTPVSVVENASRPDQKIVAGTLGRLADLLKRNHIAGPAIIFVGLAPRAVRRAIDDRTDLALPIGA